MYSLARSGLVPTLLGAGARRTLAAAEIASIDLHINMQTQGRYRTPSGWPRRCGRRLD